jgi:hypothetical protein
MIERRQRDGRVADIVCDRERLGGRIGDWCTVVATVGRV